jgi:hypothetical protein
MGWCSLSSQEVTSWIGRLHSHGLTPSSFFQFSIVTFILFPLSLFISVHFLLMIYITIASSQIRRWTESESDSVQHSQSNHSYSREEREVTLFLWKLLKTTHSFVLGFLHFGILIRALAFHSYSYLHPLHSPLSLSLSVNLLCFIVNFVFLFYSGTLLARDLSSIVKPEDIVETENLTTLFVVVPRWVFSFFSISSP